MRGGGLTTCCKRQKRVVRWHWCMALQHVSSLWERSADIWHSLTVSKVTVRLAILRGSHQPIPSHPLSHQAAASRIHPMTVKPFFSLALWQWYLFKTLMILLPMVGKCWKNGIDDEEQVIAFRTELPMCFLILVLLRSQQIVLVEKCWIWLERKGRQYRSWSQLCLLIYIWSKLMSSKTFG